MDSQFRYNKLYKQWVLFAPSRAKRPMANNIATTSISQECPFDEGNEHLTPNELLRVGDENNWRCRVVPNLYNALSIEEPPSSKKVLSFEQKNGFGAHEVIIETPDHKKQMFEYETGEFFDYFNIIKLRVADLKKDIRLRYLSIFKNHGVDAGASQEHAHSQIIATPFLPKKIKEDMEYCKEYKLEHERDFFDDLISDEKNFGKGILFENNSFIALNPYASKYPFEILIICKEDIASIIACEDKELYALSEVGNFVFKKLFKALGDISFNMILKNGDLQNGNNPNRFHIIITPRLYKTAGFEIDSDIFINTFLPEVAAKILLTKQGEK
ncbi:MAG: galactose-1-phosphate uridylyltransferase [Campylobacterota bacterium]|nr:galactose-1-phosphate uridylyltransferase [Campylobacterota bacterium]